MRRGRGDVEIKRLVAGLAEEFERAVGDPIEVVRIEDARAVAEDVVVVEPLGVIESSGVPGRALAFGVAREFGLHGGAGDVGVAGDTLPAGDVDDVVFTNAAGPVAGGLEALRQGFRCGGDEGVLADPREAEVA